MATGLLLYDKVRKDLESNLYWRGRTGEDELVSSLLFTGDGIEVSFGSSPEITITLTKLLAQNTSKISEQVNNEFGLSGDQMITYRVGAISSHKKEFDKISEVASNGIQPASRESNKSRLNVNLETIASQTGASTDILKRLFSLESAKSLGIKCSDTFSFYGLDKSIQAEFQAPTISVPSNLVNQFYDMMDSFKEVTDKIIKSYPKSSSSLFMHYYKEYSKLLSKEQTTTADTPLILTR